MPLFKKGGRDASSQMKFDKDSKTDASFENGQDSGVREVTYALLPQNRSNDEDSLGLRSNEKTAIYNRACALETKLDKDNN